MIKCAQSCNSTTHSSARASDLSPSQSQCPLWLPTRDSLESTQVPPLWAHSLLSPSDLAPSFLSAGCCSSWMAWFFPSLPSVPCGDACSSVTRSWPAHVKWQTHHHGPFSSCPNLLSSSYSKTQYLLNIKCLFVQPFTYFLFSPLNFCSTRKGTFLFATVTSSTHKTMCFSKHSYFKIHLLSKQPSSLLKVTLCITFEVTCSTSEIG